MEEESEYKKLPIEERCVHKLWKARVNGYEEAAKLFHKIDDEKSPEWNKYLGLVKKFVTDSNAVSQEKGLEATLVFMENCGFAGKTVGEVISGVVSKCIAAPKTKTKELAIQVALMCIEIEKQDVVVEELLKGMEHKNPKIVAACISTTTLALQEFGSKVIPIKPLVKKIPVLLSDRDKTVRDEGKAMVVEMFRWVGAALKPQLASLQPVQVTELEAEFEKVKGQSTPTRFLRSQQHKQANLVADGGDVSDDDGDDADAGVTNEIDPYDLMEPVDILSKLPKDFFEKVEDKKWQERKEAVEKLEELLKAPKLESGDYGDIVRALKKIITKDTNVMVIALAGKCLAALATGLKKRFQPYAGACVPALLEKFREKKQNVVVALREAIDAVFLSTNLEAIQDDVLEALNNKNPAVKAETATFLARAFSRSQPVSINKKLLKAFVTALLKTLNEPDPTVRDSSAEALGTLMKLVGDKQIMPFLTDIEPIKLTKIKECCDKAVIHVKIQAVKKDRPSTAPIKTAGSVTAKPVKRPASGTKTSTTSGGVKKAAGVATKKTGGGGGGSSSATSKQKSSERELSADDVDEKAAQLLTDDIINGLSDSLWKTRLSAMEKFVETVNAVDANDISTQVLVRVLIKKPGLKDTNFQVLRMRLECIKMLAETYPFSTVTADFILSDIADKLGDIKNGGLASDVLTAIAEATKLDYVAGEVLNFAFNQKSPKVQQEALIWLANAIKEFGLTINTKSTLEYIKKALNTNAPAVRAAGITLAGVMYWYGVTSILNSLDIEKPGVKQQLESEIEKYSDEKPPPPTRGVNETGTVTKSSSRNSILDEDDADDDNSQRSNSGPAIERVDISSQINDALINELGDKNWKVRIEALGKVLSIITETKRIGSNIGDLPQALAPRLIDSNSKIAQTTISVCEALAKAMGPACKQYVRTLFPGLLQGMGDSKTWIRTSAVQCINVWGDEIGYKEFFDGEMIADVLKTGSPTLRIELWAWLAEKLPKIKPKSFPREELTSCVPYLYTNLEDRNADVRKNAQEAVLGIMLHLGYESMLKQSEKLKPGSRTVVVAALDKARPSLPVKPLPSKNSKDDGGGSSKVVKSGGASRPSSGPNKIGKTKIGSGKSTTSSRKKEEDIDTSPLLALNNLKNQRSLDEQKLKVLKWNFVQPREEFVDLLKDQMTTANVNKTLIANMFHADFRYHLRAIESLTDDLPDNIDALIANLDLILKWLTLRFFDTNPSVLLKGLEYLQTVFSLLVDSSYVLSDNEASSFIPYLILKVGDPKDAVRNGVRALFRQIAYVFPANKLFAYIMEGLKSKNARQRTECLDELGMLIGHYGMSICQPSAAQALREIAKQISDRDNSVRNAALNCIVQAYRLEGDKVYRLVGQINDKDMSLLEERIKRAAKTAAVNSNNNNAGGGARVCRVPPAPVQSSTTIVSPSRSTKRDSIIYSDNNEQDEDNDEEDDEEQNYTSKLDRCSLKPEEQLPSSQPISGPFGLDYDLIERIEMEPIRVIKPQLKQFDLTFIMEETSIPKKPSVMPISPPKRIIPSEHVLLTSPTSAANHHSMLSSASTLSKIQLAPIVSPNSSSDQQQSGGGGQEQLIRTINEMASPDLSVALMAISLMDSVLRSSKANLMSAYENNFMSAILEQMKRLRLLNIENPDTLKAYRACLAVLVSFYESKVVGRQISREVLGGMMDQLIGLLTNKQLTSLSESEAYTRVINIICVRLIERSDHTNIICTLIKLLHDSSPQGVTSQRYVDLLMKCLWKVVKLIPNWADELDYDQILLEVHIFFTDFPSSWWKQQPIDTPSRTMKTVLHAMAKIKQQNILSHLTLIPNANNSELYTYLVKILKSFKQDECNKHHSQMPLSQLKKETVPKPLSRAMHNLLSDIFQKIGVRETTKEGLLLLYEFREQHPEADIEPFLKRSSQFFQEYIEKGLEDIAAQKRKHEARNQSNKEINLLVRGTENSQANLATNQQPQMDSAERWMEKLRQSLAANPTSTGGGGGCGTLFMSDENLNSMDGAQTDMEAIRRRLEQVKSGFQNGN